MSHTVHIHTSAANAFFVNSFVIEGRKSLILVDTQLGTSKNSLSRRGRNEILWVIGVTGGASDGADGIL